MEVRLGHWAIIDVVGKGGHVRTVPMPIWVKEAVDRCLIAAKIDAGRVFRAVSRHGTPWGAGVSENAIWYKDSTGTPCSTRSAQKICKAVPYRGR